MRLQNLLHVQVYAFVGLKKKLHIGFFAFIVLAGHSMVITNHFIKQSIV